MSRKIIASLLITSFIVSCASTGFLMAKAKVTMYREAQPPKGENESINIYRTKVQEITYIELAEMSCEDTDDNWAMKQILIKAKEIGADGIIIIGRAGAHGIGIPIGNMVYTSTAGYGLKAIANKYIVE